MVTVLSRCWDASDQEPETTAQIKFSVEKNWFNPGVLDGHIPVSHHLPGRVFRNCDLNRIRWLRSRQDAASESGFHDAL